MVLSRGQTDPRVLSREVCLWEQVRQRALGTHCWGAHTEEDDAPVLENFDPRGQLVSTSGASGRRGDLACVGDGAVLDLNRKLRASLLGACLRRGPVWGTEPYFRLLQGWGLGQY